MACSFILWAVVATDRCSCLPLGARGQWEGYCAAEAISPYGMPSRLVRQASSGGALGAITGKTPARRWSHAEHTRHLLVLGRILPRAQHYVLHVGGGRGTRSRWRAASTPAP